MKDSDYITLSSQTFKKCSKGLACANKTKNNDICSTFIKKPKEYAAITSINKLSYVLKYPTCCTFDKLNGLITQINEFKVVGYSSFDFETKPHFQILLQEGSDISVFRKLLFACKLGNKKINVAEEKELYQYLKSGYHIVYF